MSKILELSFLLLYVLLLETSLALTPSFFDSVAHAVAKGACRQIGAITRTSINNPFLMDPNDSSIATATLISPSHAITSAHVFVDHDTPFSNRKGKNLLQLHIEGKKIPIRKAILHPDYKLHQHDIAIISLLPHHFQSFNLNISQTQNQKSQKDFFLQTGWHQNTQSLSIARVDPIQYAHLRNKSSCLPKALAPCYAYQQLFMAMVKTEEKSPFNILAPNLSERPEPGDSGAPLYRIIQGKRQLYGIHSGVLDVSISEVGKFILSEQNEPEKTSVGIWTLIHPNFHWMIHNIQADSQKEEPLGHEIHF